MSTAEKEREERRREGRRREANSFPQPHSSDSLNMQATIRCMCRTHTRAGVSMMRRTLNAPLLSRSLSIHAKSVSTPFAATPAAAEPNAADASSSIDAPSFPPASSFSPPAHSDTLVPNYKHLARNNKKARDRAAAIEAAKEKEKLQKVRQGSGEEEDRSERNVQFEMKSTICQNYSLFMFICFFFLLILFYSFYFYFIFYLFVTFLSRRFFLLLSESRRYD